MSCVRSEKVFTSCADTLRAQDLGRCARVFIIDTDSLLTVSPEVIIAVGAVAGGAQDLDIGASSQVIHTYCLIVISSEEGAAVFAFAIT